MHRMYLSFPLLCIAWGQTLSAADQNADGLRGPVQSVVVETAALEPAGSEWKEKARQRSMMMRFNKEGQKTEFLSYNPEGKLTGTRIFEFDDQGKEQQVLQRDGQGKLISRETYRAVHGNEREKRVVDGDGKLLSREVETQAENLQTTVHYSPDGKISERVVIRTDDKHRPVEVSLFNGSTAGEGFVTQGTAAAPHQLVADELMIRVSVLYNESGDDAELSFYSGKGDLVTKQKMTGELDGPGVVETLFSQDRQNQSERTRVDAADDKGNWTKRTFLARPSGSSLETPQRVEYRQITYY